MSFSETIFLFFLALIIFGPKKLPEIARQVGKWMNEFRRASNEFKAQIEQEIAQLEIEERRAKILPPSPPPQGTASRALNAASSESSLAQPAPASAPAETGPAAVPASSADFDDEPLFARASATSAAAAAEPPADPPAAPPVADAAAASPSQESHA